MEGNKFIKDLDGMGQNKNSQKMGGSNRCLD